MDTFDDKGSVQHGNCCNSISLVLVSPCPPPTGGITRWTESIMFALEHRHDLNVVLVNSSLGISADERTFIRKIVGMLGVVKRGIRAVDNARREKCVIHVCTSGRYGFIRDYLLVLYARFRNVPSCVHMHFGRIPEILKSDTFEAFLLRSVLSAADFVVTMDRSSFNALKESGQARNIANIPNPIPIQHIKQPVSKDKTVLFVGHVYKEKGIEILIEAWRAFEVDHPCWNLDVVGRVDSEYERYLSDMASGLSISFLGEMPHEDTLDCISKASILVLPSYSEGFPNVILEAMLAKTVAIGSLVGAIPEMLDYDERLLVPCGDSESLYRAMSYIANNPEESSLIADRLRLRVTDLYGADSVADELLTVWRRALEQNGGE